jgi:hypothetical protein
LELASKHIQGISWISEEQTALTQRFAIESLQSRLNCDELFEGNGGFMSKPARSIFETAVDETFS